MTNCCRLCAAFLLALTPVVTHAVPQRAFVNFSTRLTVGTGGSVVITNFTVEGSVAKTVLVRAVGPTLASFGIAGALADPTLSVYNSSGALGATNDNWGGTPALVSAFAAVGAFTLSPSSKDAAILLSADPGTHTVVVSGVGNTTGVALVEVYDMDVNPRLATITTRAQVGTGANSLVAGFTLSGSTQMVLVRALGPALGALGVSGAMADPTLTVLSGATSVGTNDNWGGVTALSDAATTAGLVPLASGSRDAALLLGLMPGSYTAQLSGVGGTTGVGMLEITVIDSDRAVSFAPALTAPLQSQTAAAGSNVIFAASYVAKPGTVTFQWKRNGVDIAGATTAILALSNVQTTAAGDYSVVLANSAGTTTSAAATLAVTASVPQRALVNLSTLNNVGTGEAATLVNFIVEGTVTKPILVRAVGPSLSAFGVTGAMADPALTVHGPTGAVLANNDDWGGAATLKTAFSSLGAFALASDTSKDAALQFSANPGIYTVRVFGNGNTSGTALIEVYDTDTTLRLPHFAARAPVSSGGSFTTGFVVTGAVGSTRSFLIRALGPALGTYGVAGALGNPTLSVFSGNTSIGTNDNWAGVTSLSEASTTSGLLPLPLDSNDAALLLNLGPGAYTTRVSGVGSTSGLTLVEIAQIDSNRAAAFAPALVAPLLNQSAVPGSSVTFGASYLAKPPAVAFQWRKNGANIPGATSAVLTLANVQAADTGDYSVVMTNSAGTTTTAAATLTLHGPPSISIQPSAQAVAAGGTATFSVVASGAPAPAYQWLFNGAAVSGATSATLTVRNVQPANTGNYSVRVSNSLGEITSAVVALTIAPPPVITTQPVPLAIIAGEAANLRVVATGTAPLSYQWRKDGTNVTGATAATFSIAAAQVTDSGSYTCVVTDVGGAVTSDAAMLTVTRNYAGTYFGSFDGGRGSWALVVRSDGVGTYVAFLNNPKSGIVATVAVAPDGSFRTTGVLIQPQAAAQLLAGRPVAAAGAPFTLAGTIGTTAVTGSLEGLNVGFTGTQDAPGGAPSTLSGIYQATGVVSAGTTYAVVGGSGRTVLALTIGATLVDGGLGSVNSNGTFSVATGGNTQIAGTVVPTTGNITATITPAGGAAVTVTGAATNGLGAPVITNAPAARSVMAGAAVGLTLTVGGKTPLTYQWKKNGTDVAGATSATYSIAAAQLSDAGSYTCAIANSEGSITSAPAVLTVAGTARIVNLSILTDIPVAGDNFTLGYVVGGSGTTGAKPLVIRAAGPSLGALGYPGTMGDPKIEIFAGGAKTGENDNWGGSAQLAAAISNVGAFAFTGPTSRDAAIATSVATSNNSVIVSAAGAGTGAVIAEVYDATPNDAYTAATPRLVNVSVLKQIGSGFTVGFVIGGSGGKSVLIRAVGPGLAAVGVASGTLADPKVTLFAGSTKIEENDNWGGTVALTAAMAQNGAFAIPAASRDAALLATLQPGQYSARVEGPAGAAGLVLVEVYEVP